MQVRNLINIFWGDGKDTSLEYRLFLATTIIGIIVGLLGTIISLILSSSFIVIIITISLLILMGILYYYVRFRKIYKPFVAPVIVMAIAGIGIIWIVDGGINGSNLFVGFVILVLSLIIVPDKNKKYVISLFIVMILIIYLVQLYRPDLIIPFSSEKARWNDSLITAIYSSLFIFFIIKILHRSYNIERQRANNNQLKYKALSENSQDCIARFDRGHRCIYMNNAGLLLRGVSMAQIIGKTNRESGFFEVDQIDKIETAIEHVFETEQAQYTEMCLDGPKGKAYFNLRLFPEFNSIYEVGSVIGVSRDISDLKLFENELLQLNLDKDRFISILGHDLKSPLITLLGLTEILQENIRDYNRSEILSMLTRMKETTKITYNLLEDILTWTKAQSGKIPFQPQQVNFIDLCENVIGVLGPNASGKNIEIGYTASDTLVVLADVEMLKTILRNLVTNAVKFTDNGGKIHIKAEEKSDDICISVSDNGIGISKKTLSKLFSMTEVISTEGTANEKGTGLGLLLCKEFVEKHGGKIWVESDEGKGSTFNFTLPKTTEL